MIGFDLFGVRTWWFESHHLPHGSRRASHLIIESDSEDGGGGGNRLYHGWVIVVWGEMVKIPDKAH